MGFLFSGTHCTEVKIIIIIINNNNNNNNYTFISRTLSAQGHSWRTIKELLLIIFIYNTIMKESFELNDHGN